MMAPGGAGTGARRRVARFTVLGAPVLALTAVYVVLAAAAHDSLVLGLPGVLPVDGVAAAAAGLVILWHRRHHPVGWILFAAGVGLLVQTDGALLSIVHYRRHADPLPMGPVAVLADMLWMPLIAAIPHALARFPDGRIPLRGARVGTWLAAAVAAAATAAFYVHVISDLGSGHINISASTGDPVEVDAPHGVLGWFYAAWAVTVVVSLLLAVAALLMKARGAAGETRQQLRWFTSAALFATVAVIPVVALSNAGIPDRSLAGQLPVWVLALGLAAIPASIVVSILKFRLYDLNIVISRTISYGLLAAGITAAYLGMVTLLGVLAQTNDHNLGLSVVATLTAAALFQPMRAGADQLAQRLVFGRRATPYEALSEFADQLALTQSLDTVLPRAAEKLGQATAASSTHVWLRADGNVLQPVATWPSTADVPATTTLAKLMATDDACSTTVSVADAGEVLGALTVKKRASEPLTDADRGLLHQLAAQAGLVLRNAKLSADLSRRLDELVASRHRLVEAQDQARRRLERDLHDGAQQQLIAINMRLGRLRARAGRVDEAFASDVQQLQDEIDTAIDNIRALSRGIYPPLLIDKGLVAALHSSCRDAPVPVVVEAEGAVGRWPQEVEAAAYFCISEALQNVFRHARASRAVVNLHPVGGWLHVEVRDDGCGFQLNKASNGSGLVGIADRVEALRGRVDVRTGCGDGTVVVIDLPVARAPNDATATFAAPGLPA
jgi:signal transduction histidine kinase